MQCHVIEMTYQKSMDLELTGSWQVQRPPTKPLVFRSQCSHSILEEISVVCEDSCQTHPLKNVNAFTGKLLLALVIFCAMTLATPIGEIIHYVLTKHTCTNISSNQIEVSAINKKLTSLSIFMMTCSMSKHERVVPTWQQLRWCNSYYSWWTVVPEVEHESPNHDCW